MSPETKARRAAARQREKYLASLKPVDRLLEIIQHADCTEIALHVDRHGKDVQQMCWRAPTLDECVRLMNEFLEQMGFRPVRTTRNMLNPDSPTFFVDINCPAYMDPGCESYHSA
jgi:hypothetical protein